MSALLDESHEEFVRRCKCLSPPTGGADQQPAASLLEFDNSTLEAYGGCVGPTVIRAMQRKHTDW